MRGRHEGPPAGQTGCVNGIPNFYSAEDLRATLSNNTGLLLFAKYAWGAVNLFGGYEYFRNANPSDDYPAGFKTTGLFSSQWRRGSWRMRLRSRAARQRAFRMLEPPAARIRL